METCFPLNGVEEVASLGGLFCEGRIGGGTAKDGKVGELLEDKVGGGTTKDGWQLCTLGGWIVTLATKEKLILLFIRIKPSLLQRRERVLFPSLKLKFSIDKFMISSELCVSLGGLDNVATTSETIREGFSKISNRSLVRLCSRIISSHNSLFFVSNFIGVAQ